MGENISKDQSREAMKILSNLTGGAIKYDYIHSLYKEQRKPFKDGTRRERERAIESAFLYASTHYDNVHGRPELTLNEKVREDFEEAIYKRIVIAYPNASPVQFILEVYEVKEREEDQYSGNYSSSGYYFRILLRDGNRAPRAIYSSRVAKIDGELFEDLEAARDDGVESLDLIMVDYALDCVTNNKYTGGIFESGE